MMCSVEDSAVRANVDEIQSPPIKLETFSLADDVSCDGRNNFCR